MINSNKFKLSYCKYCFKLGHVKRECHLINLHSIYKKCNIPKKYWSADDPIKKILLNENIKSSTYRNKNITIKIY